MKTSLLFGSLLLLVIIGSPFSHAENSGSNPAASSVHNLDGLLQQVKQRQKQTLKDNAQREQRFLMHKDQQAALVREAQQAFEKAQQLNNPLVKRFEEKQKKIDRLRLELSALKQDLGNIDQSYLQFTGDFISQMQSSIIQTQFPEREIVFQELLAQTDLTELSQLRQLWVMSLEEMQAARTFAAYTAKMINHEGKKTETKVLRLGAFSGFSVSGNNSSNQPFSIEKLSLLHYLPATQELLSVKDLPFQQALQVESTKSILATIVNHSASSQSNSVTNGAIFIDPSKGLLLSFLDQSPSLLERIKQGKEVGLMIVFLAISGLFYSLFRICLLLWYKLRMRQQLKVFNQPNRNNALGRILLAVKNKPLDQTLQVYLDEAILKELPRFEQGLKLLKLLAAIAPLLGLLGTVIGMIATFQSISLFGSGDPKLMAGGISQALVTTVLGLLAAIPLLLMHNILQALSQSSIQLLDEQSAALLIQQSRQND